MTSRRSSWSLVQLLWWLRTKFRNRWSEDVINVKFVVIKKALIKLGIKWYVGPPLCEYKKLIVSDFPTCTVHIILHLACDLFRFRGGQPVRPESPRVSAVSGKMIISHLSFLLFFQKLKQLTNYNFLKS